MTDIRKGDLVRGTHRTHPERVVQGRVREVVGGQIHWEPQGGAHSLDYRFEVLDRPVDEELLVGAIEAYRNAAFNRPRAFGSLSLGDQEVYRQDFTAVIEFVNEYNAKEKK